MHVQEPGEVGLFDSLVERHVEVVVPRIEAANEVFVVAIGPEHARPSGMGLHPRIDPRRKVDVVRDVFVLPVFDLDDTDSL